MTDIPDLLEYIFQGIFNTFDTWASIEFLGTNMLKIMLTFLIANALVTLMIVINNTKGRNFK